MVDIKNKRHLFFDLDDTLWDFEKNSGIVLEQLFEEYDLKTKLQADFDTFLSRYKNTNLALWSQYYKRQITKEYLRNHRFNEVFKQFEYDNYYENLEITQHYLDRSPRGTALKDGCLEVLNYLRDKYRLHIITNGFKEVQAIKMEASGLKPFFDHVIISEVHQLTKPDERIFRLAEELTGASTSQCVMIGDNVESDINGALNAGWMAIHFHNEPVSHGEVHPIRSLYELKKLF